MAVIKIKNNQIAPLYNTLDALKVEGVKYKRGKGRLQNRLKELLVEYQEDIKQVNEQYFQKDDDGNFKQDGQKMVWKADLVLEEKERANEELKDLMNEEVAIDLVTYESKIRTFFQGLEKDEFEAKEELKDDDFELLYDLLESAFHKEDKKEVEKDENK